MQWLTENWLWLVIPIIFFLMMRRGGMGGCGTQRHHHHDDSEQGQDASDRHQSMSPTDGVTGEAVDSATALTSVYHGQTYYFSSKENRDKFEASPEYYARPQREPEHRRRHHGC